MKTTAPSQVRKQENALFFTWQLRAIVFLAAIASPSAKAEIYVFGQQLSFPKYGAMGTILARDYITPQQLCGQSTCDTTYLWAYPNGGESTSSSTTITTKVSGISIRLLINGRAYGTGPIWGELSQPIEVQLVRYGQILGGPLGDAASSRYYGITYNISSTAAVLDKVKLTGTVTSIDGTCSVPSQTVKLPKTSINSLDRIGSTAGTQSFQLRINDCPKGYNRIGYTLDPVGGTIANSPGVLPLASGSTASGMKIRVENAQGAPATMGTSITVDGYNKAADGSFAIPMQASYIRTDTVATPGTVNGTMTVLLDYR
ncbi:fimbrial protein [Pseudomonas chlororaphis]|uniref:fimbrial protein n=1 Tax=Pseudomonas chlororaphis TaxID=587753 RepID=UPI00352A131C